MVAESLINVRYAETDKMGVVYHTNYGIWYEKGRTDWLKKIGLPYAHMESIGVMVPVLELNIKYITPAYYDENIIVRTSVEKITPVKIKFEYNIYKEYDLETIINKGYTTHCWVDEDFKLINLKKKFPDIYAKIIENV